MGKIVKDITNQRFGKLIAIKPLYQNKRYIWVWQCQCDCGNICEILVNNLTMGTTRSCGCLHKEVIYRDITGQRFGRLVAIKQSGKKYNSQIVWECKCDCGNITHVLSNSLRRGLTRSCGCLQKEIASQSAKIACIHNTEDISDGKKKCSICKLRKPLSEFGNRLLNSKIKYNSRCKICDNEYRKQRNKNKRKTDESYRLNDNISVGIYQALRKNKAGRHWEALVGYTLNELKIHLEKLFQPGMTWENYGKYGWHVDHVIPQSWFTFILPEDEQFKQCWALSNLQPRWANENLTKHAKYIG